MEIVILLFNIVHIYLVKMKRMENIDKLIYNHLVRGSCWNEYSIAKALNNGISLDTILFVEPLP